MCFVIPSTFVRSMYIGSINRWFLGWDEPYHYKKGFVKSQEKQSQQYAKLTTQST